MVQILVTSCSSNQALWRGCCYCFLMAGCFFRRSLRMGGTNIYSCPKSSRDIGDGHADGCSPSKVNAFYRMKRNLKADTPAPPTRWQIFERNEYLHTVYLPFANLHVEKAWPKVNHSSTSMAPGGFSCLQQRISLWIATWSQGPPNGHRL